MPHCGSEFSSARPLQTSDQAYAHRASPWETRHANKHIGNQLHHEAITSLACGGVCIGEVLILE
eukprot:2624848-Rhodomonas_salina.1